MSPARLRYLMGFGYESKTLLHMLDCSADQLCAKIREVFGA